LRVGDDFIEFFVYVVFLDRVILPQAYLALADQERAFLAVKVRVLSVIKHSDAALDLTGQPVQFQCLFQLFKSDAAQQYAVDVVAYFLVPLLPPGLIIIGNFDDLHVERVVLDVDAPFSGAGGHAVGIANRRGNHDRGIAIIEKA